MTQEEKDLLLKDLCARLPYGVKVSIIAHNTDYEEDFGKTIIAELTGIQMAKDDDNITYPCFVTCYDKYKTQGNNIETIKPYLHPMSSMTMEEETLFRCELPVIAKTDAQLVTMRMELFLKGHLDFNHLIEKGLALEAPEDMYKTE